MADPVLYDDNPVTGYTAPSATGTNAIAIGDSAVSSGLRSTAIGISRATGTNSFAANITTNSNYGAQGTGSTAIGTNAHALGSQSIALGQGSYTGNSSAIAIGTGTYATGIASLGLMVNYNSSYGALATAAVAIGSKAKANATNAIAIGNDALSTTANLIALGGTADTVKISGAYTLPTADGTNGQVLTTDGSGAVTFADAGGGGADLYAANESSPTAQPSATGTNSIGIGDSAVSSGARSVAFSNSRASGDDSFAAAMMSNSSSYGASGTNSIAMGQNAKANGYGGVALGFNAVAGNGNRGYAIGAYAQATNNYSLALGNTAEATGYSAIALGWADADATKAVAIGDQAHTNGIRGAYVFSNGHIQTGHDCQTGTYLLKAGTTDATAKALTTNDSNTASTDNQIILTNYAAFSFSGTVVAREFQGDGSDYAAWEVKGTILRDANAGSTVLGQAIINDLYHTSGASAWDIALTADTTNGGLKISATGAASTNIRWVGTINTSEVRYEVNG